VVVAAKPTTTAKAPSRAALKVSESPAPVVNLPQRTLTGVIEMGDRSAVLFELNGVTQRVYVGESIGSTGWNLVEVAKDAAIFRRNGEVRNVGIGQKL
jgi:type II secretory pathway component PulC